MPNPEVGLITAIIDHRAAETFAPIVRDHWFSDVDTRRAWGAVRTYYETFHETISRKLLAEQVPSFGFQSYDAQPEALADIVEKRYVRRRIATIAEEAVEYEDPAEALAELLANASALATTLQRDEESDIASSIEAAINRYEQRKANDGVMGLPFPWPPMQRATRGARNGNFILFWGRQKSMKTWIAMYVAYYWYYNFNRRVMFVSREMPKEQMQDRFISMFAGVDYGRFLAAELSEAEVADLYDARDAIEEMGGFHVVNVQGHGSSAARQIFLLAEQLGLTEGDVVVVDGMYFFAGEQQDWSMFKGFSQGLKTGAIDRKLVLVATSQGNRNFSMKKGADDAAGMGMGDAPLQDCDAAVKLKLHEDDGEIRMVLSTLREGKPCEWSANARPANDFALAASSEPEQDAKDSTPKAAPTAKVRRFNTATKKKKGSIKR